MQRNLHQMMLCIFEHPVYILEHHKSSQLTVLFEDKHFNYPAVVSAIEHSIKAPRYQRSFIALYDTFPSTAQCLPTAWTTSSWRTSSCSSPRCGRSRVTTPPWRKSWWRRTAATSWWPCRGPGTNPLSSRITISDWTVRIDGEKENDGDRNVGLFQIFRVFRRSSIILIWEPCWRTFVFITLTRLGRKRGRRRCQKSE